MARTVKNLPVVQAGIDPWIEKIRWRRKWKPTLVFLPGESHRQRNLEGCSLWGHKESDMAGHLTHTPQEEWWRSWRGDPYRRNCGPPCSARICRGQPVSGSPWGWRSPHWMKHHIWLQSSCSSMSGGYLALAYLGGVPGTCMSCGVPGTCMSWGISSPYMPGEFLVLACWGLPGTYMSWGSLVCTCLGGTWHLHVWEAPC